MKYYFTHVTGIRIKSLLIVFILSFIQGHLTAQVSANFTANNRAGCSPLSVQFTNLSTASDPANTTYLWDLGNGNTSVFPNPFVIYTQPGNYTVTLTVTDDNTGASSTLTETNFITVYGDPNVDFTVDGTNGCAPFTVNFTDISTGADTNIVSWLWDFGDGNISTDQNPIHTFNATGIFDITLVVEDANGCQGVFTAFDLINTSDVATIDFTADQAIACTSPHSVTFTPTVNPASPNYNYLWDFGDGNTSTDENPTHLYTFDGFFDVTLTVSDQNGCSATEIKNTYIQIDQPNADFISTTQSGCVGQGIQFFNTSTGADDYLWNFGDGNTSTAEEPSHVYLAPGTYTVSLRATNTTFGCTDQEIKIAHIVVQTSPSVNFTSTDNISCQSPHTVNFTDISVGATSWLWDFGNGSTSNSANVADHTYVTPGNYDVSLTVTNAQGCSATETKASFVRINPPQADFVAGPRTQGCLPLTTNFISTSTTSDPIITYLWNFGDGTSSTDISPTHTYTTEGQFDVSLIIITQSGCRDTIVYQDFIRAGFDPNANFIANPLQACVGDPIDFTDLSSAGTEWFWTFGDGTIVYNQNPTHVYGDTGVFTVRLVVGNFGCYDTLIRPDYIEIGGPIADFNKTPDNACGLPTNVTFFDQSIQTTGWFWDFGDGNSSTLRNPTHLYTASGTYTIRLIASDSVSGCIDEYQENVTIGNPIADFNLNPTFGCSGTTVNLANLSQNATAYLWEFGDGNTSTDVNPTHTYTIPGTYTIRLTASDGFCDDTISSTSQVQIVGSAPDFTSDVTEGCLPLAVNFADATVPSPGKTVVNWLWEFGDGNTSNQQNPSYTYTQPGSYTVTLTVLDSDGCLSTHTKNAYINPTQPTAEFSSNDSIACPNTFIQFNSLSTGTGITHYWEFGDGTNSPATNPVHVYPGQGIFSVILTVTDINGCTDVEAKNNYIRVSNPTANFIADSTQADCPPLPVNFFDQSSSDVVSWFWEFGDGSTATQANPAKVYSAAGNYDVRLTVTTAQGCNDTEERIGFIEINGPTGSFDFTPKVGCYPLEVTFTGSGANIVDYTWDFGDGLGGNGNPISHTYTSDTIARPVMLIEDVNGCQVAITTLDSIQIQPLPIPDFDVDVSDICLGQVVSFTNTTQSESPITQYFWDFGDGATSALRDPQHTYTTADTFSVKLRVTTADGCVDSVTQTALIQITNPPQPAFLVNPAKACVPSTVSFTESSTGSFPIVDWNWQFGDGDSASGQVIPSHTYDTAGVYNASLTVTDNQGCQSTLTQVVQVDSLPVINFSANRYGCAPRTIQFTDSSGGQAAPVNWFWDFGDGGPTSTLRNPTHTYASDGTYDVTLTVTDANGCTNVRTRSQYIVLDRPVADFTSTAGPGCPPQTVQFTDLSIPDTTISWFWDFGDGATSTLQNPGHTYQSSDTFDVKLVITNIFGCSDSIIMPDHVITYQRPSASFTLSDVDGCAPSTISMSSTSMANGAPLASYRWNFGNGITSTGANTSYFYTLPGTYDVTLVARDQNGCRDTAVQTVEIYDNPQAEFMANITQGCAIENITFTDLSTPVVPILSWEWEFGDGGTGAGNNPTYAYLNDGIYDVSLTITDINGCQDSITKAQYIELDHPNAEFIANTTVSCPGETITFQDLTTGISTPVAWVWNFGDGNTSTLQNPTHAYLNPGLYTVSLTVTDALGCESTIIKNDFIQVLIYGTPDFNLSVTQGCQPLRVEFADASLAGDTSIVGWSWDFGDGGTSPVQNPTYIFQNPGNFSITLTITDANGCTRQISKSVEVLASPQVDFIADRTRDCSVATINFQDNTTSPFVLTQWEWDFGDGNTATTVTPSNTYLLDGTYNVSLKVTDQNGCVDSLTRPNFIQLTHPVADFTLDGTIVCPNDPIGIQFTDTSIPDTTLQSWFWDFGDGNTSNLQHPNHVFTTPGSYTVELIVTNVLSCSDTITQTNNITVQGGPTASIDASILEGCEALTVQFSDSSIAGDEDIILWNWDFRDGNTSNLQHPQHTFNSAGNYMVRLLVTDRNGCEHADSVEIRVLPNPGAEFTSDRQVGCSPETINFQDLSTFTALINDWQWDFGDGNTATIPNPSHIYTADGNYNVSLKITDTNGCQDSIEKINFIRLSHPQANFTTDVSEVCPNIPIGVSFTDTSIPDTTIISWSWNFGDGNSSTLQNPSHSYSTPGIYPITLEVTNILGCTDQITQNNAIEVLAAPQANFGASTLTGCVPLAISFSDSSTDGDALIVSRSWDFGDGNTSTVQNPAHTFDSVGVFTILLTVLDANGCESTISRDVEVYGLPTVDFSANPRRSCSPVAVAFIDVSSGNNINQWQWNFGDGNTSNLKDPSHVYASDGTYDVTLQVTDQQGCTQSITRNNYIHLTHPQAGFSISDPQICPGDTVAFTDQSIPDTTLMSYSWDFGDGNTSILQHPSHVYNTPGQYSVSLTITNILNCSDNLTLTDTIQVVNPPSPNFQAIPPSGCRPVLTSFTDLTVQGDEPLLTWNWDFGDGNTSIAQNPSHQYDSSGVYTISLTVEDGSGCSVNTTDNIEVFDLPTVDFIASQINGCAPQSIVFTDLVSSSTPITSYLWDFGDGNTSVAQRPTHTYQNDGTYTVSLIIFDQNGCGDTIVKPNYIQLTSPAANFTANTTEGCPGTLINFTNNSIPDTTIVSYQWDFGDGNTSTLEDPTNLYTVAGVYDVSLIITNARNCRDTIVMSNLIEIFQEPTSSFTFDVSLGCTPLTVNFTDLSVGNGAGIDSRLWVFGNGTTSTAFAPGPQMYDSVGSYDVTLFIRDANGCTSSSTETITTYEPPVSNFIANQTEACAPANIQFTDLSTGTFNIVAWSWDFGDGQTSTIQNPTHTYLDRGVYTVSLTVTDEFGCQTTFTRPDYIQTFRPDVDFSLNTAQGCAGFEVFFRDRTNADTSLVSWLWDFGDGNSSTDTDPVHIYTTAGTYDVSLTVIDARGCTHSISKPNVIEILEGPEASFTLSDTVGCPPLEITLTNTSIGNSSAVSDLLWDLGEGSTSVLNSFNHIYSSVGTYTISLTATDEDGCFDVAQKDIVISSPPTASFFSNLRDGCAPLDVPFNDISSGSNPLVGWEWKFGDGDSSSVQHPIHRYNANGVYDVELIVTDINACSDTLIRPAYIDISRPTADFTFNRTPNCEQLTFQFTDNSIPDTTLVSWFWNFGDGGSSTLLNPQYTYSAPGTYTISLIVTNVLGCTDTASVQHLVEILSPATANFVADNFSGCVPLTVQFSDSTSSDSIPIVSWDWQISNGTQLSNQNPAYNFTVPGIYDVSLTTTDSLGCVSSITQQVEIFGLPQADFDAVPQITCSGAPIQFSDQSTHPFGNQITSWSWEFGDGNTSTAQNPVHTYTQDTVFLVMLTIEDEHGCTDTAAAPDFIRLNRPAVDFTIDKNQICPGEIIQFTDLTVSDFDIINFEWDFGDGTTSNDQNPTHTYLASGTYTITLQITDSLGCLGTEVKTDTITVDDRPIAQFIPNPSQVCLPYTVSFQNTTTPQSSPISTYQWSFGDGNSSILADPSYTYSNAGDFDVELIATDQNGCADTSLQTITTLIHPLAQFTASDSIGCAPLNIQFISQSTGDRNIIAWEWDFGDGTTSNFQFPNHTFNSDGSYDIRLVVTDVTGCTDTLTKSNFINLTRPTVDFTSDKQQICPGVEVNFTDITSPDTTLVGWQWNFGDGNTSNVQHPTHLYADSGAYTVTLTVRNVLNCTATIAKTELIDVIAPPLTQFTPGAIEGCAPFPVNFTNTSQPQSATISGFSWDFGNGNSSVQTNGFQTYNVPGTYNVKLYATDSFGCIDSAEQEINIYEPPIANFATTQEVGCAPFNVFFTDSSTSTAPLTDWVWDFGDGTSANQQFVSHTYTSNGSYDVSLTITDQNGCTDVASQSDAIRLSLPQANFSTSRNLSCTGTEVQFTDESIPDTTIVDWLWDFGDGNSSTAQNPTHVFTNQGTYSVSLTITNVLGCSNTYVENYLVEVLQGPTASFTPSVLSGCRPLNVSFSDASTADSVAVVAWRWDFGNGTFSTDQHPAVSLDTAGFIPVTLTVTDANGCTGSTQLTIEVYDLPDVYFVASDSFGCAPTQIEFQDLTDSDAPLTNWRWDFGDGNISNSTNPIHTYQQDGIYDVSLQVRNLNGCESFFEKNQYIRLDHPTAQFTIDQDKACPGTTFQFTDLSYTDTVLVDWFWDFGDGNTGTGANPSNFYVTPGTQDVSLTVTDIFGCSNTITKQDTVEIYTPPSAQFSPSTTQGCSPLLVQYTNQTQANSSPISRLIWDFGEGTQSIFPNANITYTFPGMYDVSLIAIDGNECRDTVMTSIEVFTSPTASFLVSDSVGCAPKSISFLDQSQSINPIIEWQWDFGDSTISTNQFPIYTYDNNGVYDISLTISDINGCTDTLTKPNHINLSTPMVAFSVDQTQGCPGVTFQFTDETIADTTIQSYLWNFGDGTTSTNPNPGHIYTQSGSYTVSLTVTNVLGCSETYVESNLIVIQRGPLAAFIPSDTLGCTPLLVNFEETSLAGDAPIVSWFWRFNDEQTTIAREPFTTFGESQSNSVTLIVTDNFGCSDSTEMEIVTVVGPTADFFTVDTLGCAPHDARFTDLSSSDFPLTNWTWSFGDGRSSTEENPVHIYLEGGDYDVSLIVEDEIGCLDTLVKSNYVRLINPFASFEADITRGCPGTMVNFRDLSLQDTTIIGWEWDFGDGTTSRDQNPSHQYTVPGTYDVQLIITNIINCTDTLRFSDYILIHDLPEVTVSVSDTISCGPFAPTFVALSSPNQGIVSWNWKVDGASISASTSASFTFDSVGTYRTTLVVTDLNGCVDSVTKPITVFDLPEADFTVSDQLNCAPISINFRDRSENDPVEWQWVFGDGNVSSQQNPIHTYEQDGNYGVSLFVEDENGCRDSITYDDLIRLDHPEISFTADFEPSCIPVNVTFEATSISQVPMALWKWNFGDGQTASGDSLVYGYNQEGNFQVSLVGIDSLGCTDTISRNVRVTIIEDLTPDPINIHHVTVNNDNQATVRFAPNNESNFERYIILRESETSPGVYLPIDSTNLRFDTTYVDTDRDFKSRSYCYKVIVRNTCGSYSIENQTQEHCTIEATANASPLGILIDWNAYRGWNVDRYEIYRVNNYRTFEAELLAVVGGNETQYTDDETECLLPYSYRIKAIGTIGGLAYSWSDTTTSFNQLSFGAEPNEMIRATVEDDEHILVEWTPAVLLGEEIIHIERSVDDTTWLPRFTVPKGELKVLDTDVQVHRFSYSYRVSTQDSCGFRTEPSNIGKTVLLEAESDQGVNRLSWSPYKDWRFDVESYDIEVYSDSIGRYMLVGSVAGNTTEFEDRTTELDQGEYCYRIWANELGGRRARSLSNEICLPVLTNLHAPNAFSPNNDGTNDVFKFVGFNVKTYHLQIFSRWGRKVYESYDIEEGWDGTVNGVPVQEGVYMYVLRGVGNNDRKYLIKGSVTLIR